MNDEEVVVQSEQPEETQQSTKQKQTIGQKLDNFQQGMSDVGKTIETVGKGEESVANMLDGGEKATKTASNIGSAASTVADKGTEAAQKAAEAKAKVADAAAKTAETAKNVADGTAKGARVGKAASKGVQAAGEGMSIVGSSPYTAGFKVAGEATKTGGKISEGISTGVEMGAEAAKEAAAAAEAAAKAEAAASKVEAAALKEANAAAKTGKAASGAAKKASDKSFADKLRERGKLNKARGKRIQEKADKFDSEKFLSDKFGKAGKFLDGLAKAFDPKTIGVISLLIITLGTLLVSYVLSPVFFMDIVRQSLSNPDGIEKVNNYLSGLGFQNSKKAFYDEVDHLNAFYGEDLDFPYIMSALYYVDIFNGDNEFLTTDDNEKLCYGIDKDKNASACSSIQLGVQLVKYYLKESSTTTDSNGLVYSANKIYRLRDLAKHQFLGEKQEQTSSLADYLNKYSGKFSDEQKRLLQYLPWIIAYMLAHADPVGGAAFDTAIMNLEIGKVLPDLILAIQGTESWGSVAKYLDTGKYDGGVINAIKDFVTTYLNFFMDVKYVTFGNNASEYSDDTDDKTILSSIYITYYDFSFDQDKFENYLIDHYIKEMPEFSSLIRDEEGKVNDDKVTRIVYEIKTIKEIFDGIYENDKTAEENNKCIGNINLDLLSELHTPIDLTIGQTIKFSNSNNYGLYKGELHKGVDLEEDSTGTKTGDKVYSLYNGKVVESTFDDTYSDKDAKGGWLVIEYNVQYEDSTMGNSKLSAKFKSQASKIKVYYGGLDPGSIKLKQNDIVEKGQVIGNVGTSLDSENGSKPSLHFAIYDLKQGMFLNPINMFITCRRANATSCSSDSKEGKTVELPTNVFSIKQENYTVTLYDKRGFASYGIASGTLQYKVHRLWLNDGARYKNGIAVLNINGTDRYLVAVTSKFGKVGDLIYANLENDTTIPMVIADIKSYSDTGTVNKELCSSAVTTDPGCYGHKDGSLLSVLEFEFDTTKWHSDIKNPVSLGQEWDTSKKVKSISNCGTILN